MSLTLSHSDIELRLGLTVIAGFLIGFDRGAHGRPAGLRTTMLVCLAASLAMLEANQLIGTTGKAPDSFVNFDVMRLPLGILSGVGFIGAGTILRRDNLVLGVTTAATLWFVSVIGLCLGGGQIALGLSGLILALVVLRLLTFLEMRMWQDRRATFTLVAGARAITLREVATLMNDAGFEVAGWSVGHDSRVERDTFRCKLRWRATLRDVEPPEFVGALAQRAGVITSEWSPS